MLKLFKALIKIRNAILMISLQIEKKKRALKKMQNEIENLENEQNEMIKQKDKLKNDFKTFLQ